MARRNSRFVNQKIIVGNKSIQASDLTDSAKNELASDSDFVKSVVGYNSLNLTNTDQLLTTAGALSDAGLLKSSLRSHESHLNGLNNSIQTRGDSFAKDDEFINVIQTQEFSTDSDYYLVLDVPQSYIDLQAIRYDSHLAVGDLDSWRQNDFLDSFWIDNVVTNNRKVWYDSAGNNSKALKYKLGSVSVETDNLHKFFGTRAGIDGDTVIRFQILDSAKSTDAGAFLAEDDSNRSGYYTVLDSITVPLSETILNREFNIPANLAFHKGSQDSFDVTYYPKGTLTLPETLLERDLFFRGGNNQSPYKPEQGNNVSGHRVRKIRSAFRFKTATSDGLVAEPVWSRVSPKFKYVIPKPGKVYSSGTVYGRTAGAYRDRRAYFPFTSDTWITSSPVYASQSAMSTAIYGINYGDTNANYWPYYSFASLSIPLSGNYPEPQFTPEQEGTEGNEYGVMQGGYAGNAGLRYAYGVSFTTFNKSGLPVIPNSPSPGQRSHGTLTAPGKGYYMGGNNVYDSTTKRAVWNYTSHSWSNTTPTGYGSGPTGVGLNYNFGMSNDTYGHYAGGSGTYDNYAPLSTGKIFPHSNDASLTTMNAATNRTASSVSGNDNSWYMWTGYSGSPRPQFPAITYHTNHYKTTFNSGSWTSLPAAPSTAGDADGHWW